MMLDMPVPVLFTTNSNPPNSAEATHLPGIGRVGIGEVIGVVVGIGVSEGAGVVVGIGVSGGAGVSVGVIGVSFSMHPTNIAAAMIATVAITPTMIFLFIFFTSFLFYFSPLKKSHTSYLSTRPVLKHECR